MLSVIFKTHVRKSKSRCDSSRFQVTTGGVFDHFKNNLSANTTRLYFVVFSKFYIDHKDEDDRAGEG